MSYVAIIDYEMGNLDSVCRAVEECGGHPRRIATSSELDEAAHIILPGVGAFGDAMDNLRAVGLDVGLREYVIERGIPFLGVCLGMQLLAASSQEGGHHGGLGLIDAEVVRFGAGDPPLRLPHVGWNEVTTVRESPLFDGIEPGKDFYFVHSYHVACRDKSDVLATTPYGIDFVSAIQRGSTCGVQFHPEKSQTVGLRLLANFLAM